MVEIVASPPSIPSKWDVIPEWPWQIQLTQSLVSYVDYEDYEWLNQWNWHAREDGNTYYAASRRAAVQNGYIADFITMHRLILQSELRKADPFAEVDHINRNGLDNRRYNLRIVTRAQNALNRIPPNKGTTLVGNRNTKNRYRVTYRSKYIGRFATEAEAHAAYDAARKADPDG